MVKKYKGESLPVEVGKKYEIEFTSFGDDGEGVGRKDQLAIFVPGAVPKDKAVVKIIEVKKNYARGELVELSEASPDRCKPICPAFLECGGCQVQHVSYNAQLRYKTQQVKDALAHIGKLKGVPVKDTLGMKEPYHYRIKMQYPVALKKGKMVFGFYAPKSHRVVTADKCYIHHSLSDRIASLARDLSEKYKVSVYNENNGQGLLRHFLIKVGYKTNEAMLVFVTNGKIFPQGRKIANQIMREIPEVVSVMQNINTRQTNIILGNEMRLLGGKPKIIHQLFDLKFELSAQSFFQVNPTQTEVLYSKTLEYAQLTGKEVVIDAYCGIGTITLFLAKKAAGVYGVEVVESAIADARRNAKMNKITNTVFDAGKAEEILPMWYREGVRPDVIVVDPPRAGCEPEVLKTFAAMKPKRIVYVSCNPATLARDLGYLEEQGYKTVEVQPVDMFPHTFHIECVVRLERKDSRG